MGTLPTIGSCLMHSWHTEQTRNCKFMQTKNTGQLSIVTYAANTLGCIARIFTSYQDGGGVSMIRSFLIGDPPTLSRFNCTLLQIERQ